MQNKLNNFFTGVVMGLISPFIFLLIYWLWSFKYMNFIPQFFDFLMLGRVLSAVLSLCLVPNLGIFFLFINKDFYKTSRGVILSTILYGAVIVILKTWVEHSWDD